MELPLDYRPLSHGPGSGHLAVLITVAVVLGGCLNHFQIHPRHRPSGVVTWSEEVVRGKLLIRFEGAHPEAEGPFPAVLVHPEAGHSAREMRGILHSLALAGYLAVAADYRREKRGVFRSTLFAWKDPDDVTAAFDLLQAHPQVDRQRIGAMGYSQGGIFSLLIAAQSQQLRAVVAYYPVTDFAHWLSDTERSGPRRLVFRLIRRYFKRASGARTEEEFREVLGRASPLAQVKTITAPVLLIHGDRDTSADVSESQRLLVRLRELDREAELVVVEDAGHVFNFRNREKARLAWTEALTWLDRHLRH